MADESLSGQMLFLAVHRLGLSAVNIYHDALLPMLNLYAAGNFSLLQSTLTSVKQLETDLSNPQ